MRLFHEENRWSSRQHTDHEVVVLPKNLQPIHGKIQDFSFSGMFIQTDADIPPLETPVDLSIQLKSGDTITEHRATAIISRATTHGAGIKFDDYNADTVETLSLFYDQH